MKDGYTVVPLTRAHLPQVAEIERLCFSDPWSERALELYLADGTAFVALDPAGCVAAYGGMLPGADEGEIAPDTELFEEGILDSFGLVELLVQLESVPRFAPAIPPV